MKRSLILIPLLLTGCVAQLVTDSQDRQHYSDYRIQAERLNLEREKTGLQPNIIPSFDEWRGK